MRIAVRVVAALLLIVALAAGVFVWRLARAPIALNWLTPRIEAALSRPDGSVRVSVGFTELAWGGRRRGVSLRTRDLRLTGSDNAVIASIPALALRVGIRPLLRGNMALTRVELFEPQVRLMREPDGRIGVGLGAAAAGRPENPVTRDLFDALLGVETDATPVAELRRLEIVDGEVILEDRASGLTLRAPRIHLVVSRHAEGLVATLKGDLTLGTQVVSVEASAQVQADPRAIEGHLSFRGLNPAGVATQLAADPNALVAREYPELLKRLAAASLDIAGSIQARLDGTLHVTGAEVEMTTSSGSIVVPVLGPRPLDLAGVHLAAGYDAAADEATIKQLSVDLGGPSLSVGGRLSGVTTPGKLSIDATLTNLPVDALGRYWPEPAATSARLWLTTNLSRGTVTKATLKLQGALGRAILGAAAPPPDAPAQQSSFILGNLTGSVAFQGLTVRYVPTMRPVTDVSGDGTFTADQWDLRVAAGKVQGLAVGPATVKISKITSREPTRLTIAATVDGPLPDALAVIDDEPLRISREIGIVPSTVGGSVRAQVGFDFPLGGDIGLDNLGLDVSAQLARVEIPRVIEGWSVTGGDLRVSANRSGLDLTGRARLEGALLDVEWREAFTRRADMRRRVTVKGQIDAASRAALGFDLRPYVDGPIGVDLRLTQPDTAKGRIDLRLDLAPASISVAALEITKAAGVPGRAEGNMTLVKGVVTALDAFEVAMPSCEIHGRAARDGKRWRTIDATGSIGDPQRDTGRPGMFTLSVRPSDAVESFALTSDDVADLFQATGLYADGYGGQLDFTGTVDLSHAARTFDSQLEIVNFTATKWPVLGRVLTLASLTGIQQTLMNDGVPFKRISARVSGDAQTIAFPDVLAAGDSIGIAGNGSVDRGAGTVSFAGSLVPAYYGINTTLGKIPVLRDLFSGSHGLGVLGVDFSVNGPLTEPVVSVHPLESLTPDIVGRLKRLVQNLPFERKSAPGKRQ